ncbi:MAG: hypothetical protein ABJI69_09235 [Balneola sp.]
MATAKNYKVKAKSAFTGTRPLTDVPGEKKFKPKDVPFFKGLSEALTKKEAEALASQFGYKVVTADGGGNEEKEDENEGKDPEKK